jgi:hypothetical protein
MRHSPWKIIPPGKSVKGAPEGGRLKMEKKGSAKKNDPDCELQHKLGPVL